MAKDWLVKEGGQMEKLTFLQNYYGLAVRENSNDVQKMAVGIQAALYPIASTELNPNMIFVLMVKKVGVGIREKKIPTSTRMNSLTVLSKRSHQPLMI